MVLTKLKKEHNYSLISLPLLTQSQLDAQLKPDRPFPLTLPHQHRRSLLSWDKWRTSWESFLCSVRLLPFWIWGAGGPICSVHFGRNTEIQSRNTRNTPKYPSRSSGSFSNRSGWVLTQPVQIRDDHHRQEGRESRRRWLERQIQKKDRNTNTKTNTKTDTHTQIRRNTKYTIAKRSERKKSNVAVPPPRFLGAKVCLRKNWYLGFRRSVLRFKKKENHQNLILEMMGQ